MFGNQEVVCRINLARKKPARSLLETKALREMQLSVLCITHRVINVCALKFFRLSELHPLAREVFLAIGFHKRNQLARDLLCLNAS